MVQLSMDAKLLQVAQEKLDQRQAELNEKQELLYEIFDNSEYPTVVLNDKGHILQWNKAMEDLTGLTKESAKLKGLDSIMCNSDEIHRHTVGMRNAFENPAMYGKLLVINCEIRNGLGKNIPIRVSVRITPRNGGGAYAIAWLQRAGTVIEMGTNPYIEKKVEEGVRQELQKQDAEQFN